MKNNIFCPVCKRKVKGLFCKNCSQKIKTGSIEIIDFLKDDTDLEQIPDYFIEDREKRMDHFISKKIQEIKVPGLSGRILYVGSGLGFITKLINNKDNQVFGLDISLNILKKGISLGNYKGIKGIFRADMNNLPFNNEQFDVIFGVSILSHVKNMEKILNDFSRILKPGGKIIALSESFCSDLIILKKIYLEKIRKMDKIRKKYPWITLNIHPYNFYYKKFSQAFENVSMGFSEWVHNQAKMDTFYYQLIRRTPFLGKKLFGKFDVFASKPLNDKF